MTSYHLSYNKNRPTAGVTGAGAGVDSAWEQKKLEAKKYLKMPQIGRVSVRRTSPSPSA